MAIEEKIGVLLEKKGLTLATAESCTGGGVAARITSVAGSSVYFKGGIVAYDNEVKMDLLHVSSQTLQKYGAVSEETVIEMVKGAMSSLKTDCAIATSGIAGPDGGTLLKPVGVIWIAVGCKERIITLNLKGDKGRRENVEKTVLEALYLLQLLLNSINIATK